MKEDGQDMKTANREKAKKLKAQIMQNYKNMISTYNTSDHLTQNKTESIDDVENEVCSICSTYKKNELKVVMIMMDLTQLTKMKLSE